MLIELRSVPTAEKAHLITMFSHYIVELTGQEYRESEYPYLNDYWADDNRWAYFIVRYDTVAGFALINTWSPSGISTDRSVAEFYVLPEHRTGGIGTRAFHKLLETCPGAWEVSVMKGNRAGMAFWSKAIAASVSKDVERLELADEVVYRLKTLGIHV